MRRSRLSLFVFPLAAALVLGAGCSKKPSPEYAEAASRHRQLVELEGSAAYGLPAMDEVVALLARVPEDSADKAKADALRAEVARRKAEVEAEEAARQQAIADALKPPSYERLGDEAFPDAGAPTPPPAEANPQPVPRMPLRELESRFSGCFQKAEPIVVTGRGQRDTWELKNIANCRDRHPGFDKQIIIIEGDAILSLVDKAAVRLEVPDAGAPR
jgi:hypothetical protein